MDAACHIIVTQRTLIPRLLSQTTGSDMASTVRQALVIQRTLIPRLLSSTASHDVANNIRCGPEPRVKTALPPVRRPRTPAGTVGRAWRITPGLPRHTYHFNSSCLELSARL